MLGDALAQTLDDALAQDDAPFDYSNDIAPWFEGTVAITVLDIPFDMQDPKPPATAAAGGRDRCPRVIVRRLVARDDGGRSERSPHPSRTGHDLGRRVEREGVELFGKPASPTRTDDQLVMANGPATVEALLAVHGGGDSLAERDDVSDSAAHLPAESAG